MRAESPAKNWFVLRRSQIQGRGLFAARRIPPGMRIVRYSGERISADEAAERYDDEQARRHHTFLFAIDERTVIDASEGGSPARFVNHCCEPNCGVEVRRGRVWFVARRAIEPGEELTIDYWYSTDPSYSRSDLRRLYPCRCGAKRCRGTLAAPRGKRRAGAH